MWNTLKICDSIYEDNALKEYIVCPLSTHGKSLQWTTATYPPSEPSLELSVVPLGPDLLVDVSRMLAIAFELYPMDVSLALRIVRGRS